MERLEQIIAAIEGGKRKQVKELLQDALEDGLDPREILERGLIPAMENVSRKYHSEQFYVPEVIMASQAMSVGTTLLEGEMDAGRTNPVGVAVIGTVKGDLHDIGKNIVGMMLRGVGFQVYDIGYDVSVDRFIEAAKEHQADVLCMSAMLTTTMGEMKKVIGKLINTKERHRYLIMVGGAPVTEAYANLIGADIYARDAGEAARLAKEAVLTRKKENS